MENEEHMDEIPSEVTDGGCTSRPFLGQNKIMVRYKSPVDDKDDEYYKMNHKKRGIAVIFNHHSFLDQVLEERIGTDVDRDKMYDCLKKLGFEVEVEEDKTIYELRKKIEEIAKMDHTDNDCLVIVILTHGEDDYIYTKDSRYKIDEFIKHLTSNECPSLSGKPKIFFIQACRGTKTDDGVEFDCHTDGLPCSNVYKVPVNVDFLIMHSTIPGYYSFRNKKNGSWFIQEITAALKEEKAYKKDLVTLLTSANRRIALDYESKCEHLVGKKQVASITSMLIRLIQFSPKESTEDDSSKETKNKKNKKQ